MKKSGKLYRVATALSNESSLVRMLWNCTNSFPGRRLNRKSFTHALDLPLFSFDNVHFQHSSKQEVKLAWTQKHFLREFSARAGVETAQVLVSRAFAHTGCLTSTEKLAPQHLLLHLLFTYWDGCGGIVCSPHVYMEQLDWLTTYRA